MFRRDLLDRIGQVCFGALEDGQSFLAGVLAKLPEEQRAQVKAILDDPKAKDAVTLVGDSVLARSDYSKHMDALKKQETEVLTIQQQQTDWWNANKARLEQAATLEAENTKLKAGGTGDGPKGLTSEEAAKLVADQIAQNERGYANLMFFSQTMGAKHQALFGEPLDMMELGANPKLGKPILGTDRTFSLQDAYNEKHGERVSTKAKETEDKRINDEVEKRMVEERKKLIAQPFPLRGGQPEASVLDILNTKEGPAAHTVQTAVDFYEKLQADKAGAGV